MQLITPSIQFEAEAAVPVTLERTIATGSNDAEERAGNGKVDLKSSDLELTTDGTNVQTVGLRFPNLTIPPGATITEAWVQFRVDEVSTGATSLTIAGQAADNAATFTTVSSNVSSRPRTAATIGWVPASWPTVNLAGPNQRTPDLSAVIQQIVGRSGWASGNALALVITGSGRRTADAFEDGGAPTLHLGYSSSASGTNQPPSVGAGPDQTIVLPVSASLDATVSDDGLPNPPASSTTNWSVTSGPGTVSFANANAVDTTATFSATGTYVLRLTANDSALSAFDEVTVTVNPAVTNQPPSVGAGPDQTIVLPVSASLDATVNDDGLPNPPASSTTNWSVTSGPGTVSFANANAVDTTATFSATGTYVLRLTANDSALSAFDEVTVTASDTAQPVDEVHYTFTGPMSVAFDWRGGAGDIQFGPTNEYGTEVIAQTPDPIPFSSAGPFWEAHLTALQPGTTYHYSIGGGPDHTFTTAPTGDCRFDVEGDIGSSDHNAAVTTTQAQIAGDGPDFVLAVGDLTYGNIHGASAVDMHFNDVMEWSRSAAYMPAWGNHEWDPTDDLRNYMGRFAIPNGRQSTGTPTPAGEDWGWFDACGVRFISYPEPYVSGTWTDWQTQAASVMAAAQSDPAIHFIATFGHRPAYSNGHHAGSSTLASILGDFGRTYSKYVLNLNGHSHDYERFQPIDGVVHITSGGGGASLETPWATTDPRTVFRAMRLEHLRVDVAADRLKIDAICGPPTSSDDLTCTLGSVIDSITISANRNGSPTPSAGPDQTIVLPAGASLDGTVSDDGLPNPPASTTTNWSVTSGPSTVSFANANAVDTTTTFSAAGTYVLRLTANDSALSAFDEVTVTVVGPGGPFTLERTIATGSDDAEQSSSGSVSLSSSDLELTTDGTNVQTVGLRFPNLTIPPGATITEAWVQFRVDEVSTGATSLTIAGQAADNAATFTTVSSNISSRPRTAATIGWVPASWPTVNLAGPNQRTPDLSAVIQQIVGRSGWASGNALALVITGSGRRTADAFEDGGAPTLHLGYTTS